MTTIGDIRDRTRRAGELFSGDPSINRCNADERLRLSTPKTQRSWKTHSSTSRATIMSSAYGRAYHIINTGAPSTPARGAGCLAWRVYDQDFTSATPTGTPHACALVQALQGGARDKGWRLRGDATTGRG